MNDACKLFFATTRSVIWWGLLFVISGCIATTGSRVESFKRYYSSLVGKSISGIERSLGNVIFIGVKSAGNGNLEQEYANNWMRVRAPGTEKIVYQCHFFYEYEPQSGLIVKFRFEEKVKDACQTPGV